MRFPVLLVLSAIFIAQLAAAQSFAELGVTSFNNGDLKQAEQRFYWPIESDDTDLKHCRNRTLLRKSKNVIDTEFSFQFVVVSNDSEQLTTRQIKPVHSPSLKRA
jgi:hypothetical protein